MDQIATHVHINRDVPAGAGAGVWKLTLYTDTGYVVDAVALRTRDRKADPLEEAMAALRERQYDVGDWVQPDEGEWNAEVARFGEKDTITVHFVDKNLHLSGTVKSYGTPRFVELAIEGQDYHPWWTLADLRELGSADAHYRPYEGLETEGDLPLCTDAS
ncbi:hypothetical protein [Curtobacterium sp. VKM Ac-1395]|uniref:hypothetical protein n=1 Tax=Curtobacterium sp. VKM Ac-1395 TaxID=2783815 RepID=UPI00188BCCFD|nr:hypothetical protein [Curtobacterium sp. VKM Ac-1395]MBF4592007.1 hypothetical protein [Curtobacterium sp. VKM Ac-1395]